MSEYAGNIAEKDKQEGKERLLLWGIPRLFPYLKIYRTRIILMILVGALCSGIDALYPLFNRYALDHFVGEKTLAKSSWTA